MQKEEGVRQSHGRRGMSCGRLPDIRLAVVAIVMQHFGAHVVRCANESARLVGCAHEDTRNAEVTDFHHVAFEENIPEEKE